MQIARDGEAWRVSVSRRRGQKLLVAGRPAKWIPPKDGAEHSAVARDRLGYLQIELGEPGLGSTYDLMVAVKGAAGGKFDWVRAPTAVPRAQLRLFPEGGASFYEAVLGAWDDFVEAIRDGDRWMHPLSTWLPAEGEDVDLDTAEGALAEARQLYGKNFETLGAPKGVHTLRLVSLYDQNPAPLAKFDELEALVTDLLPMPPKVVAVIAALPKLKALEVWSSQFALASHRGSFGALELISLPHFAHAPELFATFLESLPKLRALSLVEAQLTAVPPVIHRLPGLTALDLTGVPIPDAALEALRRARPGLAVRTSAVSLGWQPGVPGVLRVPDGFPVPDVPARAGRWEQGCEVRIAARQVTVTQRWQETPADAPDYHEQVHPPVTVEDFVRQGPPVALTASDRRNLRVQLEAGLPTGTSS